MSDENDEYGSGDRPGDETRTAGEGREAFGYTAATDSEDEDRLGQDEADKLVGTEPDADAINQPTTESAQASRATRWGIQEGLAIGLVSIVSGVLIVFGLMQATGLITLPGPLEDSAIAHWSVFVALGVLFVAAFAYSQRGT